MAINRKTHSVSSPIPPRPLRLRSDTQAEDVRVELVPLIDVIFCILIFFILAAVSFSRQQAISVDLPKASSGTPQGRQILVVTLTELGQVFVEKDAMVTKDQFMKKLQDYQQQNPEGVMALYASANASYNDVVQVLDMLRAVGGDRVALATLPGESGSNSDLTPTTPPTTGVPGFSPNPGTNPYNYGTPNPASPVAPTQPQLPGLPGTSPAIPQPSPGQPGVSPGNLTVPSPGAPTAPPNSNASPGNSTLPSLGGTSAPQNNVAPGNSTAPKPGGTSAPSNNNASP